jgi:hypothetical protein
MAQPDAPADEKEQTIRELYTIAKEMYIFQGLVADIVWASEAYDYFKARVEMMVDHYNNSGYHKGNPYTETIDRSIYPKATTELFRLRWPDSGQI